MAMEIIIAADIHCSDEVSVTNRTTPQAPPMPASFNKLSAQLALNEAELQSESDSGHGGSMLFICDTLPGLQLSDSEFNEEFSCNSSAVASRRESATDVPLAPPPPPLPSYLISSTPMFPAVSISTVHEFSRQAVRFRHSWSDSYYSDYADSVIDTEDVIPREIITYTCIVCLDEIGDYSSKERKCCSYYVCNACISSIVHTNIDEGRAFITCPNPSCDNGAIGKDEILSLVNDTVRDKFERLRAEAEGSDTKRACPNCSFLTEHHLPRRFRRYREEDVQITCSKCQFVWCFTCHAPWHNNISCKQFRKGNLQFQKWTKERSSRGVPNCQKCPLCQVYIQRSTGCDHMTCNRCDTHFCYKCGGRFLDIPGIGDHYDQTSILGCEYNYSKDNPVKRKTVRGGYFGMKMAALTGYPVLFLAGVVIVAIAGVVVLPVYGGYRYYKYRKNMKNRYWRKRRH